MKFKLRAIAYICIQFLKKYEELLRIMYTLKTYWMPRRIIFSEHWQVSQDKKLSCETKSSKDEGMMAIMKRCWRCRLLHVHLVIACHVIAFLIYFKDWAYSSVSKKGTFLLLSSWYYKFMVSVCCSCAIVYAKWNLQERLSPINISHF